MSMCCITASWKLLLMFIMITGTNVFPVSELQSILTCLNLNLVLLVQSIDVKNVFTFFIIFYKNTFFNVFHFLNVFYFLVTKFFYPTGFNMASIKNSLIKNH